MHSTLRDTTPPYTERCVPSEKRKTVKLELINTIEISPYDYANSEYEYPNGSSKELPDEWDKFWRRCLSDKNLDNLKSIRKGSYLVDVNSIKNQELKEILKSELGEVELNDFEEQVGRICGGIVVKIENNFPIEPTCCGDIGNLYGWEEVFEDSNKDWKQLWIGHPWIFYRIVNDEIEFSDYYEANKEDIENIKSILKLPIKDLKNKLNIIKTEQIEFEKRIQIALEQMGIKNSNRIAKLMTGNE